MTEFIAKKKSRQKFTPLVGKLIDKAHVEHFHLKYNAWQYFFKAVLGNQFLSQTFIHSCKSFSEIPKDRCFYKVIIALQYEVKANRVATKVIKWFNEGHRLDFAYRFTGKDSRLFCRNFVQLIKAMSCTSDSSSQKQRVLVLSYIGLRLRDCCSIFNRLNINESDIDKLTKTALEYFRANSLFLNTP